MQADTELFEQVVSLRAELDDQGHILDALIRGNPEDSSPAEEALRRDRVLSIIFLCCDRRHTQSEMVEVLRQKESATSQPTVSRKLKQLEQDLFLIAPHDRDRGGATYRQTRLARALNLDRRIRRDRPELASP